MFCQEFVWLIIGIFIASNIEVGHGISRLQHKYHTLNKNYRELNDEFKAFVEYTANELRDEDDEEMFPWDDYNLAIGQCEYPKVPGLGRKKGNVLPCRFPDVAGGIVSNRKGKTVHWIRIPKGTLLFKGQVKDTDLSDGSFKPANGAWFAIQHQFAVGTGGYPYFAAYETKKDMDVIFFRNIFKITGKKHGDDYIKPDNRAAFNAKKEWLVANAHSPKPNIVGYAGCNECEVWLELGALPNLLNKLMHEQSTKFID